MSIRRQPLLTLSPSQQAYSERSAVNPGKDSCLQTTPKLPRRGRLASVSRLLASENFSEIHKGKSLQDSTSQALFRSSNCNDRILNESNVTIRISASSPVRNDCELPSSLLKPNGEGFISPSQLPFSPRFLSAHSPTRLSPNYKQSSPVRSPLYTAENKTFLGRGSFGNVTLCKYKDYKFALKIIHHSVSYVGEKNFLGIRHPHLVEIFHVSKALNKTLICMEFAGHCNLQQILDTKSELDFQRRLSFCTQIASGLRHCHEHSIVHGDVKPANVIVSPYGVCKLCDFGHSIKLNVEIATGFSMLCEDTVGTAIYAAPEVLRGARPTPLSDVYSFGILLWQVQTREMPFPGEHPHVVIYKVVHYKARPKFEECGNSIITRFAGIAKLCWSNSPEKRLKAEQVVSSLRDLIKMVKEGNVTDCNSL